MPQNVLKSIRKSQSNIAKGYSQMTQYVIKNRFSSNVKDKENKDKTDPILSTALKTRMGRIGTEFIAGAESEYLKFISGIKKSIRNKEKEIEKSIKKSDTSISRKKKSITLTAVGTLALLGGLFYTLSIKYKKELRDFTSHLSRFKVYTQNVKDIIFREGRHHIVSESGTTEPITEKRYASNTVEEASKNYTKILIDYLINEKLGRFINDTHEGSSPVGYMVASSIKQTTKSATEYLRTLMENPRMGKMYDDIYFMIYNAMRTVMGTITLDFRSKYDTLFVNKKNRLEQHKSHLETAYRKLSSFETGTEYEFHYNRFEKHSIELNNIENRLLEIEKDLRQKQKENIKTYGMYEKDIDRFSHLRKERKELRARKAVIEEEMEESEDFLNSITDKNNTIKSIFEEGYINRRIKYYQDEKTTPFVLNALKMADTNFDINIKLSNSKKKYDVNTSVKNRSSFLQSTFNGNYIIGSRKSSTEIKKYFSGLISERLTAKATQKDLLDIYRKEEDIPKQFRNRKDVTFTEIMEYESDRAKYIILKERLIEKPQKDIKKKLDKAYRERLIENENAYSHRDTKHAIGTLRTLSEKYFGETGHFYYMFLDKRFHDFEMAIRPLWNTVRKSNPFSDTMILIEKMSAIKDNGEENNSIKSAYDYDIFKEIPIEKTSKGLLEKFSLNIRDFDYVKIEQEESIKTDRISYDDIAELFNNYAIQKRSLLEQLIHCINDTTSDFYDSYNKLLNNL